MSTLNRHQSSVIYAFVLESQIGATTGPESRGQAVQEHADVADLSARQPGAGTATLCGIEHRTRSTIISGLRVMPRLADIVALKMM